MTQKNIIDGAIEYIARKTKEERPITIRVPSDTGSGFITYGSP